MADLSGRDKDLWGQHVGGKVQRARLAGWMLVAIVAFVLALPWVALIVLAVIQSDR